MISGPLCHYWGDDPEAEDAPMCRHDSCYDIVQQEENAELDDRNREAGFILF